MIPKSIEEVEQKIAEPHATGWAVIYTRPNHEKTVAKALHEKHVDSYLALYRDTRQWSDRTKVISSVLFPNYVFARLNSNNRSAVMKTLGVVGIVTTGGKDDLVKDQELRSIRRVLETDMAVEPVSEFIPGDEVVVEEGPLAGIRGAYLRRGGQGRIFIRVELLKRGLSVPVEEAWLRPVHSSLPASLQSLARALAPRSISSPKI